VSARDWDAIVVGSGIGGLTAAAFYASAGRRVLILERHPTFGGRGDTVGAAFTMPAGRAALRGLAVIALPYAFGSTAALVAFAVFYWLDWVATVPPTVALTADTFGAARVGIVFGWSFASHQLGAAFAAWAAGASRGWFGSYTFSFVSAGAPCLLAAALALRIRRAEHGVLPSRSRWPRSQASFRNIRVSG
jgi:phytoene dehydrogenase-like protein